MITAVIVDDEKKSILLLTKFIAEYCTNINIVGTAQNIADAKVVIEAQKPQLVFLDIEMPYGTGFDLLDVLEDIHFETIFITAYSQYAISAFRYASIDYLLKPIHIEHLQQAVQKAEEKIQTQKQVTDYKKLLEQLEQQNLLEKKILLSGNTEQFNVKVSEILYCIAEGSYTAVYMTNIRKFLSSKNLKHFEDTLPQDVFCRIHHGHLVNINQIKRITKGHIGTVVMNDDKELEISVRRKEWFLKLLR